MLEKLLSRSISGLVRVACLLALVGLGVMSASLLYPRALPVIFAMSVGHLIGMSACACYLLAVVLDARKLQPSSNPQSVTVDATESESRAER